MHAIRIHEAGGPEVLKYEDAPDPMPGPGQLLLNIQATGVNFADVTARRNAVAANLPMIPGNECAGAVAVVGEGVTDFAVGDVVACMAPGSYAEKIAVPAARAVKLPSGMAAEAGAAILLQGLTSHAMVLGAYQAKAGDRVLIHAGAGGVGMLMAQMCKNAGAYVYATVGSDEKIEAAKSAGADMVINYSKDDFAEAISAATEGKGVSAVIDSVGKATFLKDIACLATRGIVVLFGQASGPVEPFDIGVLNQMGGYITRTGVGHYTGTREEWLRRANEVLDWLQSGTIKVQTKTYKLANAADAHQEMQDRQSIGKLLLTP